MKLKFALAAAVLACGAFVAAQAVAEDHHDDHHAAPAGGHGGPPPAAHGGPPGGGHPGDTPHGVPHGAPGGAMMMHGPAHGGGPAMMMSGHGAPHNFDRHTYQRNFVAPRRFHGGGYVRPHGWYEHRWGYGEILPALFWTQNYWLTDYYDYGLQPPPPGFVWVRDGSDALLIDQSSGEVLQVEYDVFY